MGAWREHSETGVTSACVAGRPAQSSSSHLRAPIPIGNQATARRVRILIVPRSRRGDSSSSGSLDTGRVPTRGHLIRLPSSVATSIVAQKSVSVPRLLIVDVFAVGWSEDDVDRFRSRDIRRESYSRYHGNLDAADRRCIGVWNGGRLERRVRHGC